MNDPEMIIRPASGGIEPFMRITSQALQELRESLCGRDLSEELRTAPIASKLETLRLLRQLGGEFIEQSFDEVEAHCAPGSETELREAAFRTIGYCIFPSPEVQTKMCDCYAAELLRNDPATQLVLLDLIVQKFDAANDKLVAAVTFCLDSELMSVQALAIQVLGDCFPEHPRGSSCLASLA